MEKLTPKQVEELKEKHGDIFEVEIENKVCYLKKPTRKVLSAAATVGQKDPLKYNEIILANCWISGDEEIKTDDALFLGVSGVLSEIIEIKEATLKKL
ncbi:hypothetical protein [Butyricimonas paravirosa]|jgi:hypothetical protein|uniref:hypothetical protein n=1 Tax=Butyricimonas paravirosa TaxID=1472417 RepID=UPI00242C874C|nr:hypothetical protein [Butyricimonas paravirosa]